MEDKIKDFLTSIGVYPLLKENFIVFKITHKNPETEDERQKTLECIKRNVSKKSGIYLYKNSNEKILYIGKSVDLYKRLKFHYEESFANPIHMHHPFHYFFSTNQGVVEIYCKELDDDYLEFVEKMMQIVYKPMVLGSKCMNALRDTNENAVKI